MQLHDTEIIKAPVVSEKSTYHASVRNAYTFEVARKATKDEIRGAVEKLYKVKVSDVRTINVGGKPRRTRSGFKTTPEWKKAIVTLKGDDRIDLF